MQVEKFLLQKVVNPETGEEMKRIAVKFDNLRVLKLYIGDDNIDDVITSIQEDRDSIIKRIVVKSGDFKDFCVITKAITLKEF